MSDQHKPFLLTGVTIARADGSIEPIRPPTEFTFAPPPGEPVIEPIHLSEVVDRAFSVTMHTGALNWDDFRSLCAVLGVKPIRISWIRPRYGYRRCTPGIN